MTLEVKENNEFAKWLKQWTTIIQQSRVLADRLPPGKTTSADRQKHSAYRDARIPGQRVKFLSRSALLISQSVRLSQPR
jgi:hypothetical protein